MRQLRAEAGAGTPIGYVFALGIGAVAATVAYFATHEPGEPFPWLQVTVPVLPHRARERWARPLPQGRSDIALVDVALEAENVDRVGIDVEPVGGTGPHDRIGAETPFGAG